MLSYEVAYNTVYTHTHTHKRTVLMDIFQVNLGKPVAPLVTLTGMWGCHKVQQALISTTMAKGLRCKLFTGRRASAMPFLSSNRQHQSII